LFEHGDGSNLVGFELRYWLNCSIGTVLSGGSAHKLFPFFPQGASRSQQVQVVDQLPSQDLAQG